VLAEGRKNSWLHHYQGLATNQVVGSLNRGALFSTTRAGLLLMNVCFRPGGHSWTCPGPDPPYRV